MAPTVLEETRSCGDVGPSQQLAVGQQGAAGHKKLGMSLLEAGPRGWAGCPWCCRLGSGGDGERVPGGRQAGRLSEPSL